MEREFKAVKIKNPLSTATGWEVRTRVKPHGFWYTVCDTFCYDGMTSEQTAKKIARLLTEDAKVNQK